MKKYSSVLLGYIFCFCHTIWGQGITKDVSKETYYFEVDKIFPTIRAVKADKGIDNLPDYIVSMIPLLTTMMAIGATVMIVLGGLHMVLGGANEEQTEKGKGIMKDALVGLTIGLLAYVIITTLGNILDV